MVDCVHEHVHAFASDTFCASQQRMRTVRGKKRATQRAREQADVMPCHVARGSPQSLEDSTHAHACTDTRVLEVSLQQPYAQPLFQGGAPLPRPRPFGADSRRPALEVVAVSSLGVVAGETRDLLRGGRPPGRHKLKRGDTDDPPPADEADARSRRPIPRPTSPAFLGGGLSTGPAEALSEPTLPRRGGAGLTDEASDALSRADSSHGA